MTSILDQLNPEQRDAAATTEGPVLIFAGAGSGKTRALTFRIAHMVKDKHIAPESILAVTFTNKAANEMKERITSLIGNTARRVWAGTFHSVCARLLRADGQSIGIEPNFVIFDTSDQAAIVKEALSVLDKDPKVYKPDEILNRISGAKNELIYPSAYRRHRKGPWDDVVHSVYVHYQSKMRENNALDFDDLLMETERLLRERPEVLAKYQERFHYVLVDEYQDINHAQYKFVQALAAKRRNICVVGDDDQSIYGWRGANVGLILAFEQDYPDAKIIKLEQNYRSTAKILECAYEVIRHNKGRAEKKLWTQKPPGDNPVQYEAVSADEEAEWVATLIKQQVACDAFKYGDYAILYRANAMSRVLEEALIANGVSYEVIGGLKFYERAIIKDIVAYLRVIHNPLDTVATRRIINTPPRGIGDKTVAELDRIAHKKGISMMAALPFVEDSEDLKDRAKLSVEKFCTMMESLRKLAEKADLTTLTKAAVEQTGYLYYLEASDSAEDAMKAENLQEFVSLAKRFQDSHEDKSLQAFLEHIALISDLDQAEEIGNRVSLMTIHASKGLEFPVVFVVGMEEGIFPHERCMGDEFQLEEERRLCYVAITRAEKMLYLTHAFRRVIYGQPCQQRPSRFLKDLPSDLVTRSLEITKLQQGSSLDKDDSEVKEVSVGGRTINITEIMKRAQANALTAAQRRVDTYDAKEAERAEADAAKAKEKAKLREQAASDKAKRTPPQSFSRRKGPDFQPTPEGDIPTLKTGDRVSHAKFGSGIVVNVEGEGATATFVVAFPNQGVKRLSAAFAKLEKA